jgi:hypothetical protein
MERPTITAATTKIARLCPTRGSVSYILAGRTGETRVAGGLEGRTEDLMLRCSLISREPVQEKRDDHRQLFHDTEQGLASPAMDMARKAPV